MSITRLSVLGLSGRTQAFTAKATVDVVNKGVGTFTSLGPLGLSGSRYSFTAKSTAALVPKGAGTFTTLTILGVAGQRYKFIAKAESEEIITIRRGSMLMAKHVRRRMHRGRR